MSTLCTSSNDLLLVYQVLFNSLLYFQRFGPDNHFIAKIKKGSTSVNAADRVMALAFCIFSDSPLSQFIKFLRVQRYALDKLFLL